MRAGRRAWAQERGTAGPACTSHPPFVPRVAQFHVRRKSPLGIRAKEETQEAGVDVRRTQEPLTRIQEITETALEKHLVHMKPY